jgi:hypothetical protein
MKLETLAWVAFVLFSVMHAVRFGNGNKLPGCVVVVNRPFSPPGKGTGAARLVAARGEIPDSRALVRRVAGRDEDSAGRLLKRRELSPAQGRRFIN